VSTHGGGGFKPKEFPVDGLLVVAPHTRLLLAPISQVKTSHPRRQPIQVFSHFAHDKSILLLLWSSWSFSSPRSCYSQQKHECDSGPIEACPRRRVSVHVLTASPLCLSAPPDYSLQSPATVSITPSSSSSPIPNVGSQL
jgi:hypothetical protein